MNSTVGFRSKHKVGPDSSATNKTITSVAFHLNRPSSITAAAAQCGADTAGGV